VLLAVPPRLGMEHWSFDDLLATVHEALDLAKLRTVSPNDLSHGLGAVLPGNFLPQNATPDVPSVNLWQLAAQKVALFDSSLILGKF
jgi:hypothetical protein